MRAFRRRMRRDAPDVGAGAKGAVHHPHKMGFSAGGSSCGSGAMVTLGETDMALGSGRDGSIRIPAGFCGSVRMKPTHGLVPYSEEISSPEHLLSPAV